MIKRFMNRFVLQIDVTFNINVLSLSLFVLVYKINILFSFVIAYCYVIFDIKTIFDFF